MEETVIVIMLKDAETGFLEKELGSYTLSENGELVFNIYAEGTEDEKTVVMRLTCEKELEDWEYDAVYDYYDPEPVGAFAESVLEEEGHYEPVWVVRFPYQEEQEAMEERLRQLLYAHKEELASVYEAIKDKKDEYCEE